MKKAFFLLYMLFCLGLRTAAGESNRQLPATLNIAHRELQRWKGTPVELVLKRRSNCSPKVSTYAGQPTSSPSPPLVKPDCSMVSITCFACKICTTVTNFGKWKPECRKKVLQKIPHTPSAS